MKGVHFMKRLFTLILVFVICATIFIIPTSAETYDLYDSRYLTEEEKVQLDILNNEEVIKLYSGLFLHRFARREDIMSMIETSLTSNYMIVTDSEYMSLYKINEGERDMLGKEFGGLIWKGFYTYTKYLNLVFDSSVKVNKIYCFSGLVNYDGAYIYYETDHGEYILYAKRETSEEAYLFPLSDFCEYAKAKKNIDGASMKFINEENYLLSNTPHAVPHPDTDNDEKCDACGVAIPENNDPFPHIPKTNTDKPTDNIEETNSVDDQVGEGCDSSIALSAIVLVGVIGTAFVIKKKED